MRGMSRADTVLTGEITLSAGSTLEDVSVTRSANSASTAMGIVCPASGAGYVRDCIVSVTNAGAGNGIGLYAFGRGGALYVYGGDTSGSDIDYV